MTPIAPSLVALPLLDDVAEAGAELAMLELIDALIELTARETELLRAVPVTAALERVAGVVMPEGATEVLMG